MLEHILIRLNVLPHPAFDTLINSLAARALQASVKLGIIETFGEGERSIEDIAKICKIDQRPATLILECLESMGYVLITPDKKYDLTRRGKKFLLKNSTNSNYNFILFSDYVLRRLAELEENIKRGGPINSDINIQSDQEWQIFNESMIEMAKLNAKEVAHLLPISKKQKKLLDLGGSHGLYAIEICKIHSQVNAEILDFEPTKRHAENLIGHNKMINRITFQVGDFLKENIKKDVDIVLLFNVIHAYDLVTNTALLKKIYNALNPGGLCIILDQIKGTAGNSQLSRFFASSLGLMLFNQANGQTYYLNDIRKMFQKVGFQKINFKKIRTPGFGLVIAYK